MTALQSNVFLTGIHRLLVTDKWRSLSPLQTTSKASASSSASICTWLKAGWQTGLQIHQLAPNLPSVSVFTEQNWPKLGFRCGSATDGLVCGNSWTVNSWTHSIPCRCSQHSLHSTPSRTRPQTLTLRVSNIEQTGICICICDCLHLCTSVFTYTRKISGLLIVKFHSYHRTTVSCKKMLWYQKFIFYRTAPSKPGPHNSPGF